VTGPTDKPIAEVDITLQLVRALLLEQHPDLAGLDLAMIDAGWDNVVVRLGDRFIVRLPRRELAAPLITSEQRWLPGLAASLPLPVPAPVRVGVPSLGYPWNWSITPWFDGEPATVAPPHDGRRAAEQLGTFLAALHQPAPADAPVNPYRGIPLAERTPLSLEWIHQLGSTIDGVAVASAVERHEAVEAWTGPPLWLHGDLHPANVIVHRGEVAAIIDFGDLTAGDPATDLAIAWMLLDPIDRPILRAAAGVDAATWHRGRGWALALGLAYLAHSASTPAFALVGRRTVEAVMADPDQPRPA
jgi:aminoglycoside phosphotransferase (APT) family kinase protein